MNLDECMETCQVGVLCPHGKSCDHIGAGRLTPQELENEYEILLVEVKRLRKELMRAVDWHLDYIEGTSGSAVDFLDHVEGE